MQDTQVTATLRTEKGRKTNELRAEGDIPGVVYGFDIEPVNISLNRNLAEKLYKELGESTVLQLAVDGKEHPVLIQDIQRDPLTDFMTHIDFRRIDLSQKVEAVIRLSFIGESLAVKSLGGTLVTALEEVEVSALPNALVSEIEVDISSIKTFDDSLHVSDISVPEGIEILTDADQTIAAVQPPRTEAEMAELDEEVEEGAEPAKVGEEAAADGEGAEKEAPQE